MRSREEHISLILLLRKNQEKKKEYQAAMIVSIKTLTKFEKNKP